MILPLSFPTLTLVATLCNSLIIVDYEPDHYILLPTAPGYIIFLNIHAISVLPQQEIEKLWKMVDAAHDKESRARDTINQLKLEIANLTKLVEQGAGLNFGQDASVQELMKQKEELTKERDAQLEDIVKVRSFILYSYQAM